MAHLLLTGWWLAACWGWLAAGCLLLAVGTGAPHSFLIRLVSSSVRVRPIRNELSLYIYIYIWQFLFCVLRRLTTLLARLNRSLKLLEHLGSCWNYWKLIAITIVFKFQVQEWHATSGFSVLHLPRGGAQAPNRHCLHLPRGHDAPIYIKLS